MVSGSEVIPLDIIITYKLKRKVIYPPIPTHTLHIIFKKNYKRKECNTQNKMVHGNVKLSTSGTVKFPYTCRGEKIQ